MYLNWLLIYANNEIVDRYKGGFVHKFHGQAVCITRHYSDLIRRKIKTVDERHLIFMFTDQLTEIPSYTRPLPTGNLEWPFEFAKYVVSNDTQKKKMILESLHTAALTIAHYFNWDTEPLTKAYKQIIENGYAYGYICKKSWVNPDKKFRVKLHFNYELDSLSITAILFRGRSPKELTRCHVANLWPSESWEQFLQGRWLSNTVFQIQDTGFTQKKWQVDFSNEMTSGI